MYDSLLRNLKKFSVMDRTIASELDEHFTALQFAEAVILGNIVGHKRNNIIKFCTEHGIEVACRPKIGDILMNKVTSVSETDEFPLFIYENKETRIEYRIVKRLLDIVISFLGIVILSPVIAIVATAIKRDDNGPVLYKQIRLTKDSKPFEILKFRSMRVNAESTGVAVLAAENDDRITKVGKVLRAYRLDELPQMFNILRGDMTIVGPRPERPEIISEYIETIPEFNLRLKVKAGLTGYAQVFGRYNTEPYEKLQMDLIYIANQSLYEDIRIMFYTVRSLFSKESTQGVLEMDKRSGKAAA
jgi:exopolysaccharide biosynthesis polyprenyl glycosylphosphotransferase